MGNTLKVTDWRQLKQGDIILVEGKPREVVNIECHHIDDKHDPFVIAVNPHDDLEVWQGAGYRTGWFNTNKHHWEFVSRPS